MEYRNFGNNGMKVSVLGLGASHIGSDSCSEKEAEQILNEVLDSGITLIDTARMYGKSEERIGKYISKRRDEYVLSSKCGYDIPETENWTGEAVSKGVDHALKLLKTDVIDIMHLHSCDKKTLEQGDVIEALVKAKEAGKIRVAAYSGDNEARHYAIETGQFSSIQTSMNICDQQVIDKDLPLIRQKDYGLIIKRPLANVFWRFEDRPVGDYCEPYWVRAKEMGLDPGDYSWLEYALRFSAHQAGVHSVIAGTSNIEHLRENVRVIEKGPLPGEVVDEIRNTWKVKSKPDWFGQT